MALIACDRHRPEDLAAWAALERLDRVALMGAGRRSLDAHAARAEIMIAGSGESVFCGVSWGKDSVVVAHLVRRARPDIPLVWVRLPRFDNPDCGAVRDAFLAAHPGPYEEIWCPDPTVTSAGDLATGARTSGYAQAARRWRRRITGLRADESRTRRISMRRRGLDGARSVTPIGWWSAADVFRYLLLHDLPVHPAYAMNRRGMLDRDWLRVASLGGLRGTAMGRRQWEWEYYEAEMMALGVST